MVHRLPADEGDSCAREERLLEIHGRAESLQPQAPTLPPVASAEMGYYSLPVLKEPQWGWEVPVYFFMGGAAGAAALIACAGAAWGADPAFVWDAKARGTVGCCFAGLVGGRLGEALALPDHVSGAEGAKSHVEWLVDSTGFLKRGCRSGFLRPDDPSHM